MAEHSLLLTLTCSSPGRPKVKLVPVRNQGNSDIGKGFCDVIHLGDCSWGILWVGARWLSVLFHHNISRPATKDSAHVISQTNMLFWCRETAQASRNIFWMSLSWFVWDVRSATVYYYSSQKLSTYFQANISWLHHVCLCTRNMRSCMHFCWRVGTSECSLVEH